MPIDSGRVLNGNGTGTGRFPGLYAHVLHEICEQGAHMGMSVNYLLCETDEEIEAWEHEFAERKAALIAERIGKPIRCMSYRLPPNWPPPYEQNPRGGQRRFIVEPNDEIRLVSTELRTA